MKKAIIGVLLVCCAAVIGYAQEDDLPEPQGQLARRVESMKVAFITERLSLTPQEAQAFWPIYNQYKDEEKKIRQKYKFSGNMAAMTDAEAEKALENALELEQQLLNLKRDYTQRMRKAIPVRKIVLLDRTERAFREELVKRLREMQRDRQQQWRRN